MRTQKGFTLVEILIVVVILGILAAIVIPQFTDASTEAKTSSLSSDLQTVRSQIELYKIQHNDDVPAPESATSWNRMIQYSDIDGVVSATKSTTYCYGPYLQKVPTNQFNNLSTVTADTSTPAGSGSGWHLNTDTGAFHANDSNDHAGL